MTLNCLHRLNVLINDKIVPSNFTYPFCYTPDELCKKAKVIVMDYLDGRADWQEELEQGKMFGVMLVDAGDGEVSFIAAYSGLLDGKNDIPFFVPSIVDTLSPDGHFKVEEKCISEINRQIRLLEYDPTYVELRSRSLKLKQYSEATLKKAKEDYKIAKQARDLERVPGASEHLLTELENVSKFQKAELKRLKQRLDAEQQSILNDLKQYELRIEELKEERKRRSAALQDWLFSEYRLLNGKGEEKNLLDIFEPTVQRRPPAAAGDCAAPKMLQFAYKHGLRPIAMAEFWYGGSPKNEIRVHGGFYPACVGRCGPILGFMLEGLDVDENPMKKPNNACHSIHIIYEDDYMIAVDKPSGLLSAPGKISDECVASLLEKKRVGASAYKVVHRLDMATSGVLLLAKDVDTYKQLQSMFESRMMKKEYVAVLEGGIEADRGEVDLPLMADYMNRPSQKVDFESGKKAVTEYEVIKRGDGETRVLFRPLTGRTHQLRVHAAHQLGLCCPIKGDTLYGNGADRLYLHAKKLEFVHPVTKLPVIIQADCPF